MPTSRGKNLLYRMALPLAAPAAPCDPVANTEGKELHYGRCLEKIIRKNHISGAAICISSDNETSSIYTKAFHTELIPDCHTYFRVASITKMATALVAVRLMNEGILDPEKPVSEMLPGGKDIQELRNVTIRHLLSHTSGLADPPGLENMLIRHESFRNAVSGCQISTPGKVFRYSNLGFGLIGSVFEYLLNHSVEEVFRQYLFLPLNMQATLSGSSIPSHQIMPVIRILPYRAGTAVSVTELGKMPISSPDPEFHYGYSAGSMYTDLSSLMKLIVCLRDGGAPLISREYASWMKQHAAEYGAVSPSLSYGYGLLIISDKRISSGAVYGHQGFAYGCVDGAFWEEETGRILITLNGGCSEARTGRLGIANYDLCRWAFGKELAAWK